MSRESISPSYVEQEVEDIELFNSPFSEQENNLLEQDQQEFSGDTITIRVEKVLELQKPLQQLYRLDYSSQLSDNSLENMNIEQAQNTPLPTELWTREQLSLLQEHIFYHNNFADVLKRMSGEEPSASNKLPAFPSTPKRKLTTLYGEQVKKRKSMTSEELHNYVKTKQVDVSIQVRKEVFAFGAEEITSSTAAINKLKEGYRQLQRQEATTMCFNLQYGWLLEKAFWLFAQEKESGHHKDKWDEWLKNSVGISPSYSRKLREIARLLAPYVKRFSTVGLSFIEVYSMRKDLKAMFSSSEEIRKYWSTPVQESMQVQTRSSQDPQQPAL